jgi:hypothetical protein
VRGGPESTHVVRRLAGIFRSRERGRGEWFEGGDIGAVMLGYSTQCALIATLAMAMAVSGVRGRAERIESAVCVQRDCRGSGAVPVGRSALSQLTLAALPVDEASGPRPWVGLRVAPS